MEIINFFFKRPTFASIFSFAGIAYLIFIIIYQILFTNLGGGASLGITIEIIGILSLLFLVGLDRIILNIIDSNSTNFKKNILWLSVVEAIIIVASFTNYYITHDNSFSVG